MARSFLSRDSRTNWLHISRRRLPYLLTRRWKWAPALWFVLLVALCAFSTARLVVFPNRLPLYFWPFGNGAMACIMMAGVVTAILFLGAGERTSSRSSLTMAAGFAL